MKKSTFSLLFILAIALCSSVTFASTSNVYGKYVKHDLCYDVSKIAGAEADYSFSPGIYEPFFVDYNRVSICNCYKVGKLNNKALPLSKKIWLLNCQIALK